MPHDGTPLTRRSVLESAATASAAAGLAGVAGATPGRSPGPKETELLVGVAAGHDLVESVAPAVPADAEIVQRNDVLRFVAVRFPETAAAEAREQFAAAARKRPGVKYVEPNATYRAFYTPNDPRFGDQHVPQAVDAPGAWDHTLGSSSVTVAVVDQGIQYDHPDLQANVAANPGDDFVDAGTDPYPDDLSTEYHGTAVAGLIAAATDNGDHIAGLSESTLLSARALDESGAGSLSDIANAIQWAAGQGADVINLSLGGGYTQTMKNAVAYAENQGSLLVAAAGGSGASGVAYPAAYSECVAVSAVDQNGSLASFSSYGPAIELAAPGVDVLTTTTQARGTTERFSGTSFAAAVVSGCAGLAAARWNLSNTGLRNHLKGTAVDLGLPTNYQGCGRVDAGNAVAVDPANRATNCAATGGSCGLRSNSGSVTSSLGGYADRDCWTWSWTFASPCEVVVELDGPTSADFDLYVNEGTTACPTPSSYDHRSYSLNSQESITVQYPNTATDLQIAVDSYSGSGTYDLSVTEYAP